VRPERSEALGLDAGDELAGYRDRFVIDDDALIYLDGNSLGRLPKASRSRMLEVLDADWAGGLIRSWDRHWLDLPTRIGDLIGRELLGARPGEVIVNDTTTVSLYKVVSAALDARPGRRSVVIERDNFPTDRYIVESLAAQRDLDIRWVDEAGVDGVLRSDLEGVLDDDVAVTVLSQVDYRSAALVDMGALTAAAHKVGALTVWDLCHSVGAVPIDLHADEVDIAVGCTYKYLNGGPGAPSFTFVRRDLQPHLHQPIWGWWSRRDMFDMEQGYDPEPGMRAWLSGTPGILSMAAVEPGVAMVAEAGLPALRAKSVALTTFALTLYDAWLQPLGVGLASPRVAERRGGHVTLTHPRARELTAELIAAGVIPDFRRPDGIRLGLAPLTTRFVDVYDAMERLAALVTRGAVDLDVPLDS
jgi:kynureninase